MAPPPRLPRWAEPALLPLLLCIAKKTLAFRVGATAVRSPPAATLQHLPTLGSRHPRVRRCRPSNLHGGTELRASPSSDDDTKESNRWGPGGTARFTGGTTTTTTASGTVDLLLSVVTSDVASVGLGLLGLLLALLNRFAFMDALDPSTSTTADASSAFGLAETMGRQSRADLLAVFAAGAVLLNGISNLDVTSALAETVVLDGVEFPEPKVSSDNIEEGWWQGDGWNEVSWALASAIDATPARTAVLLVHNGDGDGGRWRPVASAGIVPSDPALCRSIPSSVVSTPILDKFLRVSSSGGGTSRAKESYLPTLQALPGKTEFTYLPVNAQEALVLPVVLHAAEEPGGASPSTLRDAAVLVLGGDTAKSFSPRDVAWCQVLASRLGESAVADG